MASNILNWRGGLLLKGAVALALIALGDAMFFQRELYAGHFGIYGLVLLLGLIAARPAVRRDRRAWAALALAAAYAGAMIHDASVLAWCLFWIAAGLATLLPATGRFDDGWRWFQRLLFHGVVALLGPLIDLFKLQHARHKRRIGAPGLRRALPVLILPLIGSAVIVALFTAANPMLEQLFASLTLPGLTTMNVVRLILWGLLFTLIWGLLRPRLPRRLIATFDGSGDLALPGVSVGSVLLSLVAFNLLFAMQNTMDAAWLWGLVPLPDGMTLAAYAHRGAYPLIATALLAALFVLVTLRPGSSTANRPAIRCLVVLWIGQNLFLVASSIQRTLDYVDAYSLTRMRIAALLWMVLVALGLVLICWRMLRGCSASWLINANLIAAGVLLSACTVIDLGEISARWNVRHAREVDGTGAGIDLCYLNGLDGAALLPLIELEQRPLSPELHRRVSAVRQDVLRRLRSEVHSGGWTWLGQHRVERAEALLPHPVTTDYAYADHDCYGREYAEAMAPDVAAPAIPAAPAPAAPALTGGTER